MKKGRNFNRVEMWLVIFLLAAIAYVLGMQYVWTGDDWRIPPREVQQSAPKNSPVSKPLRDMPQTGEPVRFLSYNVCNYFEGSETPLPGYTISVKKEESRDAVADTIKEANPDVVGLCEVGSQTALNDLRSRLKKRGLNFSESFLLARPGEMRFLAILSKYPITGNRSQIDVPLEGGGKRKMLRGILDVTIQTPDRRSFRFVGVHLKSKKDDDGSASHVRRLEAYALRDYLTKTDDGLPLVVYGDFNDDPISPALQIVMGGRRNDDGLKRLLPHDDRNETWTLRYGDAQAYLSYDHLLVNKHAQKRLGKTTKCGIVANKDFLKASDHRALWVDIK